MAGKQPVDPHRKLALRNELLGQAVAGAVYLPFCGDGDIAAELYGTRPLLAIDLDPARIATISERLQSRSKQSRFLALSADSWPGKPAEPYTYAVADFDAYSYPYDAFRGFWEHARKADRMVLYFTDGEKQAIIRAGHWRDPDGTKRQAKDLAVKRAKANSYWSKTVEPWFREAVKPWTVVRTFSYTRGGGMLYWGAVIERQVEAKKRTTTKQKPPKGKAKAGPKRKRARRDIDEDDAALGTDDETPDYTDEELGYNPLKVGKFDPLKKRAFLDQLKQGNGRGAAADAVGVTLRTVEKHLAKFEGFTEAVSLAEMHVHLKVENALVQAAISGNVTAIQVYLYNRMPDRWTDKRAPAVRIDIAESVRQMALDAGLTDEEAEAAVREASMIATGRA